MERGHRWRRIAVGGAVGLLAAILVFHLAGGWYFSNVLHHDALDGKARRAQLEPNYDLEVVKVDADSVTIRARSGSIRKSGVWGLASAHGYGQVSEIVRSDANTVTRRYRHLTGRRPAAGTKVELDEKAYPTDPKVGLDIPFENVTYGGALGSYPAWYIPGDRTTWAIVVHGNGMTRRDGLRIVPVLVRAGLPTLVITFRNDPGAPEDPSGMLRYGATEWRDLQSAVRYALDKGAHSIVLVGYSMGGAIVTSFLERSHLAPKVSAVVLDSPVLDLRRTVEYQASDATLPLLGLPVPGSLTATALWISSHRFDLDWGSLDYLHEAGRLRAPILVLHGAEDDDVPIATSEELAKRRPDLVTLVRVPRAGHMESWNVNPATYERTVYDFVAKESA
jgi:pimeloyl-ACP methyl ester carboxylesterase